MQIIGEHILNRIGLLFILVILTSSCSKDKTSIHITHWMILNKKKVSADVAERATNWCTVKIPGTFKSNTIEGNTFRYVWLRGKFFIDDNPEEYYGISLGRVYHLDTLYINKTSLGSLGIDDLSNINLPRNYTFPSGVLKHGMNTVLIRIGIYGYEWGGVADNVLVMKKNAYQRRLLIFSLFCEKIPIGIAIYFIFGFFGSLFYYFWDRKYKTFLFSSLLCLYYIIYITLLFSPVKLADYNYIVIKIWAIFPLCKILLLLLFQSLYRLFLSNHNKITFTLFAVISLIIFTVPDPIYGFYSGPVINILLIPVFIAYSVIMLKRLNSIRPDKVKYRILICFVAITQVDLFVSAVLYLTGSSLALFIHTYLAPLYSGATIFLVIRDWLTNLERLHVLYDTLKNKSSNEINSITTTAEEKLRRVIDFINENYTSSLSREGLAAAVDLNSNYMSRLFKAYTGMKISEYINQLRIEHSLRKLCESNQRIIDIAFSVGYDNIMTFNRAFKTFMNKTPSEFRRQNQRNNPQE